MNIFTALKENKNDVRKKVLIVTTVTVGVIATAVVLSKMKDSRADIEILSLELGDTLTVVPSE